MLANQLRFWAQKDMFSKIASIGFGGNQRFYANSILLRCDAGRFLWSRCGPYSKGALLESHFGNMCTMLFLV